MSALASDGAKKAGACKGDACTRDEIAAWAKAQDASSALDGLSAGDAATLRGMAPGSTVVIENDVRLSESVLWRISQNYYENRGVKAWSSGDVPYWITNSAHMARYYAELLWQFFFLSCSTMECDMTQPFYVLEVGAGHGKLGFLVLKQLQSLRLSLTNHGATFGQLKVKYIMSDVARYTHIYIARSLYNAAYTYRGFYTARPSHRATYTAQRAYGGA